MSAFFTGWCACGVLWCIDTNDFGWHIVVFAAGMMLNLVEWMSKK